MGLLPPLLEHGIYSFGGTTGVAESAEAFGAGVGID